MPPSRGLGLCLGIITLLVFVILYQTSNSGSNERLKFVGNLFQQNALYQSWRYCVTTKLEACRGNHTKLWLELQPLTQSCNEPYASILNIKEFANSDEKKHHIAPLVNTSNNTIVTLGIGHDTGAEEQLIQAMGKDNLQFYGADPMQEINMLLYSKFGKFYPVAVAGKAGYSSADVLGAHGYQKSSVVYVDAIYFLTKMVGLTFYDDLWIDSEGGEYDMFPMMIKGGDFDQNGITICQFNMEMHMPDDAKQRIIHDFIFQILDDQRYAFFFPINVGHLRIFFVNFGDEMCVQKYIPKEFDRSKLSQ